MSRTAEAFRAFGCLAAALLAVGCGGMPERQTVVREVPPGIWDAQSSVAVVYQNTDTLKFRDLAVLVRFRNDFAYDRLLLALETLTPDSLLLRDTLAVCFDRTAAQTSSLTYLDTKTLYRSRSVLNRPGGYRFTFTCLMPGLPAGTVIGVGVEIAGQ